jgi:cysteine desulfuration protein SufE
MTDLRTLADIHEEYDFLDADERYRLLIDLGRSLPPCPRR